MRSSFIQKSVCIQYTCCLEYNTVVCCLTGMKANYLLRGVNVNDYSVQLDNIGCNITYLTDSVLGFEPWITSIRSGNYFNRWTCPSQYPYRLMVSTDRDFMGLFQMNVLNPFFS